MDRRTLEWIGRLGRLAGTKMASASRSVRKVTPLSLVQKPGETEPEPRASQAPHRYGVTRRSKPPDADRTR